MRTARVSPLIPALLLLAGCGPFKEKPLEGDPVREDTESTAASAVYDVDEGDMPETTEEMPADEGMPAESDDATIEDEGV